jgi:hypothetical protein
LKKAMKMNTTIRRNVTFLPLFLLLAVVAPAQKLYHYAYVETGGGWQDVRTKTVLGTSEPAMGLHLALGIVQDRSPRLALQYGLGLETFSGTQTLDGVIDQAAIDREGDAFSYRTRLNDWKEHNSGCFLQVPVSVLYRYPLGENLRLLAQGGLALSLPIVVHYTVEPGTLATSGYYEKWNVEFSDYPEEGFRNTDKAFQGKVGLLPSVSLQTALGLLFPVAWKQELFVGAYCSYGLYSVGKRLDNPLFDQHGKYHGTLGSNLQQSVLPVTLGLKASLYFQLDQRRVNSW